MERQTFAYGYTYFLLRALGTLIVAAAALLFLGLETIAPPAAIAAVAAVLVLYVVVFAVSPLLTRHTLTRSRLILRQGWYFRAVVPLAEAEAVGPFDGEPKYGLRITLGRRRLFVVGSSHDLVSVRLREPRRFPQALFMRAAEIVFDVHDRDGFLAAVEERVASGAPLPAAKVRSLPIRR